jgi:hypothetical protein
MEFIEIYKLWLISVNPRFRSRSNRLGSFWLDYARSDFYLLKYADISLFAANNSKVRDEGGLSCAEFIHTIHRGIYRSLAIIMMVVAESHDKRKVLWSGKLNLCM